jgi:hypothetical protein
MVEFALAAPLLLVLILGIMEFGRLFFSYSSVVTATREAARYGSSVDHYQDCAGIQAEAVRLGGLVGVNASNVHISYDDGFGGAQRVCPPGNLPLGSRIIVEVRDVPFTPVVPLVNIPNMTLHSTARRTILIGLELR